MSPAHDYNFFPIRMTIFRSVRSRNSFLLITSHNVQVKSIEETVDFLISLNWSEGNFFQADCCNFASRTGKSGMWKVPHTGSVEVKKTFQHSGRLTVLLTSVVDSTAGIDRYLLIADTVIKVWRLKWPTELMKIQKLSEMYSKRVKDWGSRTSVERLPEPGMWNWKNLSCFQGFKTP